MKKERGYNKMTITLNSDYTTFTTETYKFMFIKEILQNMIFVSLFLMAMETIFQILIWYTEEDKLKEYHEIYNNALITILPIFVFTASSIVLLYYIYNINVWLIQIIIAVISSSYFIARYKFRIIDGEKTSFTLGMAFNYIKNKIKMDNDLK